MKISLISIGQTKQVHVKQGLEFYQRRLRRYNPFEYLELPETKGKISSIALQKQAESERLLKSIDSTSFVVALDEYGQNMTSPQFASWMQQRMNQSTRRLVFCIGGAYGHGEALLARANLKLSLSSMTFPHDLVRLIFVEQLYRAFTILRKEPYHHD